MSRGYDNGGSLIEDRDDYDPYDYDAQYDRDLQLSRQRSERERIENEKATTKKGINIAVVAVIIALAVAAFFVIRSLWNKSKSKPSGGMVNTNPPAVIVAHNPTENPAHHAEVTVNTASPIAQPNVGGIFSNDDLKYITMLTTAQCARLLVPTPDDRGVELSSSSQTILASMTPPSSATNDVNGFFIMIYDPMCPTTKAVAPQFADAARYSASLQEANAGNVSRRCIKFAAISTTALPLYIGSVIPKGAANPTFLVCVGPGAGVKTGESSNLKDLDAQLKSLVQKACVPVQLKC